MSLKYDPRTGEWIGTTGGVNLQELNNRKPTPINKIQQTKEQKEREIKNQILANPFYAYAIRLVDYLAKQLNVKMGKTIFNNWNGDHYLSASKQIQFSYEHVDSTIKNGFSEYATIGHIWVKNGYSGKREIVKKSKFSRSKFGDFVVKETSESYWKFDGGKQGIWMIVLHEMAHRLQHDKQKSFAGDHHGAIFQQELNDLIILFPYSEVENI